MNKPVTEPRYPLLVALPGERVQHAARRVESGTRVSTLCRKSGNPVSDGDGLPFCRYCAARPNPIIYKGCETEAADRTAEK